MAAAAMEAALKAEVATEVVLVEALAAEVREAAEMMEAPMAASKEAAKAELAAHSSLNRRSRGSRTVAEGCTAARRTSG